MRDRSRFPSRIGSFAGRRGVALVFVLGVVVLVAALILGFFMAARQERSSSGFYESGMNARQLVDAAAGIVTAQIQEATANPDLAWISQPGLMRTFDSNGAVAAYKLYSSDTLRVEGVYDPVAALTAEVPANWASRPDEFVDLNRPVVVRSTDAGGAPVTVTHFPIADPAVAGTAGSANPAGPEGFSLRTASVPAAGPDGNVLPMPVRWIYVLGDGRLATAAEAEKPESEVVGRIAFWADDETCKVNLNTASGGVFFDAPAANTKEDHDLALHQPVAQEYQRYPGHPSATALAAVFPSLRLGAGGTPLSAQEQSRLASLVTPRISWGGSEGGTRQAWYDRLLGKVDSDRLLTSVDEARFARSTGGDWMGSDGAREESVLAGEALEKFGFFTTAESRAPELNLFNRPRITLWPFNRELVSNPAGLTPEDRLIKFASELGANKRKLYFQREDAWDSSHDYTAIPENQNLYSYLQWLTDRSFPGHPSRTGGNGSLRQKFGALGRDQILTQKFDYLRSLVNTVNSTYAPVDGPTYSFPQNHSQNISGFNDITPLVIETEAGWTKGLGGPVLNELVLQFYNAGEKSYNASGGEVAAGDAAADYLVRRIQLVGLMDFWMVQNHLVTAMPRFQVKVEGAPFLLEPNPVDSGGNPVNPSPLEVRTLPPGGGPATAWQATAISMGFPSAINNVNIVSNKDAEFDESVMTSIYGGPLGIGYGIRRPNLNKTNMDSRVRQSLGKTLDRQTGFEFFPHVSDFVEIKIPYGDGPGGTRVVEEPVALVINGGALTITLYPALRGSHAANPTNFNSLHPASGNGFLQQITVDVGSFPIPLPRLGPANKMQNDVSWLRAGGTSGDYPTYAELGDYAKRFKYAAHDMILHTPREPAASGGAANATNFHGQPMDVFRAFSLSGNAGSYGDLRLAAARRTIPAAGWYEPNPANADAARFHGTTLLSRNQAEAESISMAADFSHTTLTELRKRRATLLPGAVYHSGADWRSAAPSLNGAYRRNGATVPGDWSNGYGVRGDGSLVLGPDVGAATRDKNSRDPYYADQSSRAGDQDDIAATNIHQNNFTGLVFSPWKQMPSAVVFGTLPARPLEDAPWETLLFNPVPNGGKDTHRGWSALPRDHYWLDLFTMPVVEPFAITENLATNGKINLNQQIAPFTYIQRDTGLHALLWNQQVMAIPDTDAATYKSSNLKTRTRAVASNASYRRPVDVSATAALITARLEANDPFVSASEICEIPMVPAGVSGDIDAFWQTHRLTGDNKREMPYNHLYPRVTTRSNTFKIHYWVQSVKRAPQGAASRWIVTGQVRGEQTIERFLNLETDEYGTGVSAGEQFPALAGNHPVTNRPYYRFRTTSRKQFAP